MALEPCPRRAELMCFNAEDTKPGAELVNQIKVGPGGSADRGVVALALGVVLAFDHVEGQSALVSRDAVSAVEVEQEVAHAECTELGDAQAAEGSEAGGQAIAVVGQPVRAPGEEELHHGPVDRK